MVGNTFPSCTLLTHLKISGWCFTPSPPVRSPQGDPVERRKAGVFLLIYTAVHMVQSEATQAPCSRSIDLKQPLKTPWYFSTFLLVHTAVHMVQRKENQAPFSRSTDLKQPLKTPWHFNVFLLIHTAIQLYIWFSVRGTKYRSVGLLTWSSHWRRRGISMSSSLYTQLYSFTYGSVCGEPSTAQ